MDIPFSDYIVFVDESGDHGLLNINENYPLFVLSFCVFKKSDYQDSALPLLSRLKIQTFGHDQIILHEHDIRKKEGAFSKLGKQQREVFLDELTTIIERLSFSLIVVVIKKVELKQQYAIPENPYVLAMRYGLERLYQFIEHERQTTRLTHVLFECRGRKEDAELELEFKRVRDGDNYLKHPLPFEIVFADKKSNSPGLQLADMTARPIGLGILRPTQANRAADILKQKYLNETHNEPGAASIRRFGLIVFP